MPGRHLSPQWMEQQSPAKVRDVFICHSQIMTIINALYSAPCSKASRHPSGQTLRIHNYCRQWPHHTFTGHCASPICPTARAETKEGHWQIWSGHVKTQRTKPHLGNISLEHIEESLLGAVMVHAPVCYQKNHPSLNQTLLRSKSHNQGFVRVRMKMWKMNSLNLASRELSPKGEKREAQLVNVGIIPWLLLIWSGRCWITTVLGGKVTQMGKGLLSPQV